MAAERTLESLANRLLDLDGAIERNNRRYTDEDAEEFIESKKNRNTKLKTASDLKRFKNFLTEDGEEREIENIQVRELDAYMCRFLLSVRKVKDGSDLEPSTLRGLYSSISRYLTEKDYEPEISAKEFRRSREVLKAKCKDLKEKGKGNKPNRSEPFTKTEIETLHQKSILGNESPKALINSMWLNNTMHFGLRGRQEHLTMLWGDLELGITADGREYVSFTERATKTRNGLEKDPRQFMPKMFAQPDDVACPVRLYKLYSDKRPEKMKSPESKFYLSVNPRYGKEGTSGQAWYISQSMGKNTLGSIAKEMSKEANFHARHSNHSGRKTTISNLLDAGCHPTEVAQLSGHKNLMSLNQYHSVSIDKQQHMSSIIHRASANTAPSAATSGINQSEEEIQTEMDVEITTSDDELMDASQEIESALSSINTYEELTSNTKTVINLPVVQSPGGNVHLTNQRFNPMSLFRGCTFNGAVTIRLK